MTRKPAAHAAAVSADSAIDHAALYSVVLARRVALEHEVLPVREEPYEMRGRLLASILADVASYDLVA